MDGKVANFDLASGEQVSSFQAAGDTVNGFQFHPYLPLSATASGGGVSMLLHPFLWSPHLCSFPIHAIFLSVFSMPTAVSSITVLGIAT